MQSWHIPGRGAARMELSARALGIHGGKRRGADFQGSDATLKGKRNSSYLTARMVRDTPEILAALQRAADVLRLHGRRVSRFWVNKSALGCHTSLFD